MSLFAEVDLLKKELDELRPLSPEQEARILQKFRLDWNYNSNAIEGNSLTLGETRSLLLHGLTAEGKPLRDHLDIKGHNEAVRGLEDMVHDERPLTEQFIREMHQVLLGEGYDVPAQTPDGQPTRKHIQPGRYKSSPNNVLTVTGEMFYFASPEETPAKMTDLVAWYRQEVEHPTLHPVALAAEFHYRFVRIHPFDDGNGRMSRLLMNLILLRHGYPMTVIKATDRNRYLAALAEADAGEIELFFRFINENVEDSLKLMIRAAKGESIEEADDLDKKLALLRKQLMDENTDQEITWGLSTQQQQMQSLISIWLSDLLKQTERFDFVFIDKIYATSFQDVQGDFKPQYNGPFTNSSEAIESIKNRATSASLFREVTYYIQWRSIRSKIKSRYSFKTTLVINFNFLFNSFQVKYSINQDGDRAFGYYDFSAFTSVYHSKYKKVYTTSEIENINYQLANEIYDFIAPKVAEANLPSS